MRTEKELFAELGAIIERLSLASPGRELSEAEIMAELHLTDEEAAHFARLELLDEALEAAGKPDVGGGLI
jgi:hypothetical protein